MSMMTVSKLQITVVALNLLTDGCGRGERQELGTKDKRLEDKKSQDCRNPSIEQIRYSQNRRSGYVQSRQGLWRQRG
ncbi:hypothetical protein PGTUg99_034288 [Puccinia graminis f. sp. tritici]|uniref:Secreted protein n=1 Tax=Puccinia graminis f. sp. tritici TaxID=56615 RepID=A0A5B0QS06_PUCGR|nr:hypothetical protein PGTUg99_034288 [Puccinia graminis f. sp. tritici]